MTIDCFEQLAQLLPQHPVVLATVVEVTGSVPREVGAKMLIGADGLLYGTIGGGAGEAKVLQQGQALLATGQKCAVEIDLSGAPHRETQGICGGWMRVWLERWDSRAIALVQTLLQKLQTGQSATLVTPFTAQSPYLLNSPAQSTTQSSTDAFVETLAPLPTLLIVGAGHCGEQLAKTAHLAGFNIIVQDDRPTWANPKRYPQALQVLNQPIHEAIAPLGFYSELYAALVTRGYQYDLDALIALLQRPIACRYIGMIGSTKRVRQALHTLYQTGIPLQAAPPIHAPIGLDIGALTPAEIAISITAELILVRRGGTGKPLSNKIGAIAQTQTHLSNQTNSER
ncbi:XdhC family protein [Leptolyngbya sp. AN02str]|uniref:XdhC family protein n=1 Tax=Leptolyngbya sp. AN02str TaxID=3423363 RepID=UPI003D30F439